MDRNRWLIVVAAVVGIGGAANWWLNFPRPAAPISSVAPPANGAAPIPHLVGAPDAQAGPGESVEGGPPTGMAGAPDGSVPSP